ncbi:MAG: thioesterase [Ignavibacteriales bacterium]|nr:thioesterase [Ignavibacteriales bacterium]
MKREISSARSRGLWLFFDTKRRRPIQILDKILERWSFDEKVSIEHDIAKKIEPIDSSTNIKTFTVSRYDVDSYDHVNNIRYLYWLMESMPEDIANNFYLHSIDGRFMAEAQYGDTLISFTEKDKDDNFFYSHHKNTGE